MRLCALVPTLGLVVEHQDRQFTAWLGRVRALMQADGKIPPALSDAEWLAYYHASAKQVGVQP